MKRPAWSTSGMASSSIQVLWLLVLAGFDQVGEAAQCCGPLGGVEVPPCGERGAGGGHGHGHGHGHGVGGVGRPGGLGGAGVTGYQAAAGCRLWPAAA
ncbi:hypothetical protein BJY14_007964 [Actinomadura luteofluorescens]|uniref:Uncharacterized protein n=1 Tax=Actinomadura luteofluorescens TaxID=46163 RepID=A0A7Y9JKL8_9ACTN|nr:hypothetical protein [Actinomadura luteofluorescens]